MKKIGDIECIDMLDRDNFFQFYVLKDKPLIIKNAISSWGACQYWSEDYLAEKIGQEKSRYSISASNVYPDIDAIRSENINSQSITQKGTIAEFFNLLKAGQKNIFLTGDELALFDKNTPDSIKNTLCQDFEIPSILNADAIKHGGIWISCKDIITWLHYDENGCHNLTAQVKGAKRVMLFSPQNVGDYYFYSYSETEYPNFSQININNPNYTKFPRYANAAYYEGILNKGDMLFIPAFWLHSFQHLGDVNININFWWKESLQNPVLNPLLTRKLFFNAIKEALKQNKTDTFSERLNKQDPAIQTLIKRIEKQILKDHFQIQCRIG